MREAKKTKNNKKKGNKRKRSKGNSGIKKEKLVKEEKDSEKLQLEATHYTIILPS